MKVHIAKEEMILLSEKAIFLPEHNSLLISDLHFGKIEHFRKNGIGLPPAAARQDMVKLEKLIRRINPEEVIFLGDLFHSEYNEAWVEFNQLIKRFDAVKFHLVMGNHDILDQKLYEGMQVSYQLDINDLILTHEPLDVIIEGKYNLCGHIHPGVKLKGKAKQSLRLACFYFGEYTGILPAFGTFTGLHVLRPIETDIIYIAHEDQVVQVQ